ncbi:5'-methylthioadenosine/S-adenosylhomocysteine nucleosidase [Mesorhizobium sp. CO1-1-2]|uniref:5'-methylthioadenosine/S-adenosylhomocysteine nucleosidase family protein n=2 Tax=unclassified Mesorhizobium TaxID=325217 RepID=UPI001CCC15C0|nr:5'-methylthioadenosine/S-adenosylhomocysteine nucleosidase [Mesorhizobium sp. CO1-1-2]
MVDSDELRKTLRQKDMPLEGALLFAAAQYNNSYQGDLGKSILNIEVASPAELRFAMLLVGLNKSPENLFSRSFSNSQIIGDLNSHPDSLVAQYSVWATCENPHMGIGELRLPLRDIECHPANVRGWVYQLLTSDAETARRYNEYLIFGSEDSSSEAREGLSIGIRDIFFDSIERLVLDWFDDEETPSIRNRLLEHMAHNAQRYPPYATPVMDIYRTANTGSLLRARIEAAARSTPLALDLRKMALQIESEDLFARMDRPAKEAIKNQHGMKQRTPKAASTRLENTTVRANAAKVLIVTALPKETAAVKATLDVRERVGVVDDPNFYELGVFHDEAGHERAILLATSGMGTLNASALASNAIRSFPNLQHVIVVGIAGGCPNPEKPDEHVRLGDIVISDETGILASDFVKETREGREIRSFPQKPSAKLLGMANHMRSEAILGRHPWRDIVSSVLKDRLPDYRRPASETDILHEGAAVVAHPQRADVANPIVHSGGIAASDTLQKNPVQRDELRDRFKVRAVEMEASGIQHASWAQGKDVFVIRGICDYCDDHKSDVWQQYASLVAAAYARSLIEEMPIEWF